MGALVFILSFNIAEPASAQTISRVAAGWSHTCAVMTGGGVACWGDNLYGQLGDGTRTDQSTPTPVVGLEGAVDALAGGYDHTCALTTGRWRRLLGL